MIKKFLFACVMLYSALSFAQDRYNFITYNIDNRPESSSYPRSFTLFKGKVYFYASTALCRELWQHDGINPPTIVADIATGPDHGTPFIMDCPMVATNDALYFAAGQAQHGYELYKYDGINPPILVADISPGAGSSYPVCHFVDNNMLYFTTTDLRLHTLNLVNNTLTTLTGNSGNKYTSTDTAVILYKNKIYFAGGKSPYQSELCSYDLSTGVINTISDINYSLMEPAHPRCFSIINGDLYFVADNKNKGTGIYRYDGANTPEIINEAHTQGIITSIYQYSIAPYAAYDNGVYFIGDDNFNTSYLYKYEPATRSLTQLVLASSLAHSFAVYNDRLFYDAGGHHVYDKGQLFHKNLSLENKSIKTGHAASTTVLKNRLYYSGLFIYPTGGDGELCILYDTTLGTSHVNKTNISATIYPNPTTQDAYLDIQLKDAQTMQVHVADIQGRVVYRNNAQLYSAGKHTINLPTGTLPGGIYIYNISDEHGMLLQSGKLVKN